MKKPIITIFILLAAILLSGCGNQTAEKDNPAAPGQQTAEEASTGTVYQKVTQAMSGYGKIQLKSIDTDTLSMNPPQTIHYLFIADDKAVAIQYDIAQKKAQKVGEIPLKDAQAQEGVAPLLKGPDIPENIASQGLDSALVLLEASQEYTNYKQKNPDVFNKYLANLSHNEKYGWEWTFIFTNHVPNQTTKETGKYISFAVNLERNKVVVLNKSGMVE